MRHRQRHKKNMSWTLLACCKIKRDGASRVRPQRWRKDDEPLILFLFLLLLLLLLLCLRLLLHLLLARLGLVKEAAALQLVSCRPTKSLARLTDALGRDALES